MKVHNLGSDYAFQRKQKQENQPEVKSTELPAPTEVTTETDAGDQAPSRGEGEVMATADETSAPKQKGRKKKETGAENEQPQD